MGKTDKEKAKEKDKAKAKAATKDKVPKALRPSISAIIQLFMQVIRKPVLRFHLRLITEQFLR